MKSFSVGLVFPTGMSVEEAIGKIKEEISVPVGKYQVSNLRKEGDKQHALLLWDINEAIAETGSFHAKKDGVVMRIEEDQ